LVYNYQRFDDFKRGYQRRIETGRMRKSEGSRAVGEIPAEHKIEEPMVLTVLEEVMQIAPSAEPESHKETSVLEELVTDVKTKTACSSVCSMDASG
jgi:hypothetical protein